MFSRSTISEHFRVNPNFPTIQNTSKVVYHLIGIPIEQNLSSELRQTCSERYILFCCYHRSSNLACMRGSLNLNISICMDAWSDRDWLPSRLSTQLQAPFIQCPSFYINPLDLLANFPFEFTNINCAKRRWQTQLQVLYIHVQHPSFYTSTHFTCKDGKLTFKPRYITS